jgi:mannan endo-1,6-alpha-mannosidase
MLITTQGNDDQVFWAFTAMDAAELDFPNPPAGDPQWLALAQAVFNDQVARWDTAVCDGGLRWQIFPFNAGYDYKNTISSGGLFQLSARLARYTSNQTYADWAEKTFDWIASTPIIAPNWQIWDGTSRTDNCSGATETYWTYNVGTLIAGSAYMYNFVSPSPLKYPPTLLTPKRQTPTQPGHPASKASSKTAPKYSSSNPPVSTTLPATPLQTETSWPK